MRRADYIAGLRQLADLLEQRDDLPLPYTGTGSELLFILHRNDDQRALLAAFARAFPGRIEKRVRGEDFDLKASLRGLRVQVIADRNEVCERIVTGTDTVTKEVPDPTVQVPLVEVTETVEHVEWVCRPLLSGGAS
jgi:hypothetical protein